MTKPLTKGPPVSFRVPLATHALLVELSQRTGLNLRQYVERLVTQAVMREAFPTGHRIREEDADMPLAVHREAEIAEISVFQPDPVHGNAPGTDLPVYGGPQEPVEVALPAVDHPAVTGTAPTAVPAHLQRFAGRVASAQQVAHDVAALLDDAGASVRLDGETRSAGTACGHKRATLVGGGIRKCPDCGRVRRPDGRWYGV